MPWAACCLEFADDKIIGRRHRRPAPGQDGSARHERRRTSVGRQHDDRAHQGHDAHRAGPDRSATPRFNIAARANDVLVKTPRTTIYSRLVEGRFPKWRDVFPQRTGTGQDRTHRRAVVFGRAAGGDRHQRRKPRRRFHLRRRLAGAQRPCGRGGPVARSSCRSPTTARSSSSRSTRAT